MNKIETQSSIQQYTKSVRDVQVKAAPKKEQIKNNTAVTVKKGSGNAEIKSESIKGSQKEREANAKKVKNSVAEVNKKINQNTRCEFAYHEKTKRVSIKVINADTDEVIKEIPPEKTLDMIAKVWEMAGLFLDEQR